MRGLRRRGMRIRLSIDGINIFFSSRFLSLTCYKYVAGLGSEGVFLHPRIGLPRHQGRLGGVGVGVG